MSCYWLARAAWNNICICQSVHLEIYYNFRKFNYFLLLITCTYIKQQKKCLGLISFFLFCWECLFSSSQSPGQDNLQICDVAVGILLFQGTDTAALWLSVVASFAPGKDNTAYWKVATEFHFCLGIIYNTKNMARTNMKINLKNMREMKVFAFFNQCLSRIMTVSAWWAADSLVRSYHV